MNEQVWWYATRAAGLMTWSAAVASVIVGLLLSTRIVRARTGPWMLDLHRFLGGLTVVFLLVHLGTLWADSYIEFGWQELLVPGESTWRPRAVAWGVVAAWILIAVEVTSILRRSIGQFVWRVVHLASFATVAAGTIHAVQAGSDVDNPLTWAVAGGGSVAIVLLGTVRLRAKAEPSARRPTSETEILEEMRQRLADLPVPETGNRLERVAETTTSLPRREGARSDLDGDDDDDGSGALFRALGQAVHSSGGPTVPEPDAGPEPPAAAPAAPGFEPTGAAPDLPARTPDSTRPAPPDPTPRPDPIVAAPAGPAPFLPPDAQPPAPADYSSSPFASAPAAAPPPPVLPRLSRPAPEFEPPAPPPPDPVSRVTPTFDPAPAPTHQAPPGHREPVIETGPGPVGADPFGPVDPPPMSRTTSEPAAGRTGPPPLPTEAVDPSTGEPDEHAYREWLVEWLAYAEQYGDEAPVDTTRF